MNPLHNLLLQLESHIPNFDKTNSRISNSTIGWQIDHCLLVINGVIKQLEISNPTEFQSKFNLPKFLILTFKKIPRGKARAPKIVRPEGDINRETLAASISKVRENLIGWKALDKNANFPHPFFGVLNKKETENFLVLHTKHHLMIINDILKS